MTIKVFFLLFVCHRLTASIAGNLKRVYLLVISVAGILIIISASLTRMKNGPLFISMDFFQNIGNNSRENGSTLQASVAHLLEFPAQRNGDFAKPFIYLTQAKECIPPLKASARQIGDPKTCNCDVIVLSYRKECGQKNKNSAHITYLFDPTTTWASGRNVLYNAAMKRKPGYHYYIFMDGDTDFKFNKYTPYEMTKLTPLRALEEWLLDYEPALGVTDYGRLSAEAAFKRRQTLCGIHDNTTLTLPIVRFDGCFNAYHYKAITHIFPYPSLDKNKNWYIPNKHIMSAVELKFCGQAMMFVPLTTINLGHGPYPKTGGDVSAYWREFIDKIRETAPLAYRDRPMWKQFRETLQMYQNRAQTHCLNITRHLPIIPYAHFDRESS